MEILQIIIITFFFICCAILIFLIMIQTGKGGGLGMFGGGSSSTTFGSSTIDVVTKATWYGCAAFFILAILAAVAFADSGPKLPDALQEKGKTTLPIQPAPAPGK